MDILYNFVDEVGFNLIMRSRRGRSLRGTRAVHIVPGLRARNIFVCCAMLKSEITKFLKQHRFTVSLILLR